NLPASTPPLLSPRRCRRGRPINVRFARGSNTSGGSWLVSACSLGNSAGSRRQLCLRVEMAAIGHGWRTEMSDSEPTPRGTARVNSERFSTELAAVWYAANYYYQSSYKRGREYIGSVFRQADGKYGVTVRSDGGFAQSTIRIGDVPRGAIPT